MLTILKAKLKKAAIELRVTYQEIKDKQRAHETLTAAILQSQVLLDKKRYRHTHIAYCIMRGTPYEAIEKPRKGNEPDMALIEKIRKEFTCAQDVCIGA